MLGAVVSEIQNMRDDFRSLVEALTKTVASDNDTGNEPENDATITDDDSADDEDEKNEEVEIQVEEDEEDDDEKKEEKAFKARMKKVEDYLSKVEQSLIDNGFNS